METLNRIDTEGKEMGLRINDLKTKYMFIGTGKVGINTKIALLKGTHFWEGYNLGFEINNENKTIIKALKG